MEYTDAPKPEAPADAPGSFECPLCGHRLMAGATECNNCDWMQGPGESAEGKASDVMAVLLSLLPGLGHIYKGHKLIGSLLIFVGTPMVLGLAALAATGTAGFAPVFMLPAYWLAVMLHVYSIEDRIAPTTAEDEGEQY